MSFTGWARKLDDRVVGAAERDPEVRRRGDVVARTLLVLAVVAVVVAEYIAGHGHLPLVPVSIAFFVVASAVVSWSQSSKARRK
jgi:hypothetical protein